MHPLIRTARATGLFYLGLGYWPACSGSCSSGRGSSWPTIPPRHWPTWSQRVVARAGIALELLIVLTQALAAMWFFKLFRGADPVAAGSIAAFGLVNAVTILVSAALLATALEVALAPAADAATTVQLMYLTSGNIWGVGGLFFGLWLIPMGTCVLRSGWMPRHSAGSWSAAVGYVISAFTRYLVPDARWSRFPRLSRDRGRVLDRRLSGGPRRPPPRTRRSAARRRHGCTRVDLKSAESAQSGLLDCGCISHF